MRSHATTASMLEQSSTEIAKFNLELYVTPSLHTRCMHLQTGQLKDSFTKFTNLEALRYIIKHMVLEEVLNDFYKK